MRVGDPGGLAGDLAANLRARALYQGSRRVRAKAESESEPEPAAAPGDGWEDFRSEVLACTACGLCDGRTNVVFGEGSLEAEVMFVGEAPGRDEDAQGRPFVGRAGKLLTDMILAMGFQREEVYIANVLKCRPPNNRDPQPDEVAACLPYLHHQIERIRPKVLCALGRHAFHSLSGTTTGITKVRGKPMPLLDRILVPTYHPAYLLRNPAAKRDAWEDLQTILGILGRPVPKTRKNRP